MALLVRKEKSRTMKFDILSPREDFKSKLQVNKLDIINKNLLYLTHEVDKCVSMLRRMEVNANLQTQVTEYFDDAQEGESHPGPESTEDTKHIPEV